MARRDRMRASASAVWSRGGPAAAILRPVSWLYRGVVAARRRLGVRSASKLEVPVISIGNLTVGGTGKTPMALWLTARLAADGVRSAIVTRGYGGRLADRVVTAGVAGRALLEVEEVGDEAVLLAERFPGPVVCGADRVAAARMAIDEHGAQAIILDDGFQHWRLARDVDVVLVDGSGGLGNGALLPAGPLREPASALARASAIVVTKGAEDDLVSALARRAGDVPVFAADLVPRDVVSWRDGAMVTRPLGDIVGRRAVTVSAIGQPRSFYRTLGDLEVRAVEVLEYPDHHAFTQEDWQRITQAGNRAELIVCTEKDLVKLRRFPFARGRLVAVRADFTLAPGDDDRLYERICTLARLWRGPSN